MLSAEGSRAAGASERPRSSLTPESTIASMGLTSPRAAAEAASATETVTETAVETEPVESEAPAAEETASHDAVPETEDIRASTR